MALALREEPLTDSELPYDPSSEPALTRPSPPVEESRAALAPPSRVSPIQSEPLTDNELPVRFKATRGPIAIEDEAPDHVPPRRSPYARYRQLEDENPDLYDAVNNAAKNIGVPPSDLAAVVYASSGNDPDFRKNGRIGYGGLTNNDARELDPEGNLDINNPIQNLYLSAIKLKTLKRAFGEGPEAIGAYYYGRDAINGVLQRDPDEHARHLPEEGFGPINRYYGAGNSPVGAQLESRLTGQVGDEAASQADAGMQRQPLSPGPTPQMGAYAPRASMPATDDDTFINRPTPPPAEQSTAVRGGQAIGDAIRRGIPIAKEQAQQAGQAVAAVAAQAAQGVMAGGGQLGQALQAGAQATGQVIDDIITGVTAGAQGRRPQDVAEERAQSSRARGIVAEAALPPAVAPIPPRDARGMAEQAAQEDTGMQRFGPAAPEGPPAAALVRSRTPSETATRQPEKLTPQEQNLVDFHESNLNSNNKVMNPDGSVSTVRAATVEGPDGKTYIIPTVWGGRVVSFQEARQYASQMGWENFPSYANSTDAIRAYEEKIHPPIIESTDRYFGRGEAAAATQADAGVDRPLPGRVVPPEELTPPTPTPKPEPPVAAKPEPALKPPSGRVAPVPIPGAPTHVSPAPAPEPPPPASSPAPRPAQRPGGRAGGEPTKQQPPPAATTGRGGEPSYAEPTPTPTPPTGAPASPEYSVPGTGAGQPGAIAAPGSVAARPAPGPIDRFNSSPTGITPVGIVRAADNGGPDGVLTYLSRAPRGMAITEAWDHAQDLLARAFIIKGDLNSAMKVPAYIHAMKHAGALENMAKGIAAMESGDLTTAAQYLARSHAYVSDGTVIGFQVVGNQIVGQRYDEQTHDKSGKPFVVTPAGLRSYAMAYSDLDKFVSSQNAERQTTETGRHNREEEKLKGRQIDESVLDRAARREESKREFDVRQEGLKEQREYNRLYRENLQQQKDIENARKEQERQMAKTKEVDADIADLYFYDPADPKGGPKDISGKPYDRPNAIAATALFRAIRLYNRDIGTQQAQSIEQNVMAKRYKPYESTNGWIGFFDESGTMHAQIPHSAWRAYLPPLSGTPAGPQRPVIPAPGVR